jgi:hypothetical protein
MWPDLSGVSISSSPFWLTFTRLTHIPGEDRGKRVRSKGPIPDHQWMFVLHDAGIVSQSGSWRMSMPRSAGLKNMPTVTTT